MAKPASVLRNTKPCDECPWRRKHPAGWLGGYHVDDFIRQIQYDGPPLSCHKTIPAETNRGKQPKVVPSMCAGALVFMNNSCKSARHPDYGNALDQVEEDPVNIFQWPHEFREHHADPEGWVKQAAAELQD